MYTTPYINGAPIDVPPAALADVVNPATQRPFAKVFMAQPEHMRRAIDAAYACKDVWGHTLAAERELILQRAADVTGGGARIDSAARRGCAGESPRGTGGFIDR